MTKREKSLLVSKCSLSSRCHKIRFLHFLFSDINSAYPFLQLSDLKNGVFDQACKSEDIMKYRLVVIGHSHQNFVKGNVVSVSASGLEGASYLLIEDNEDVVSFEHIRIEFSLADYFGTADGRHLGKWHERARKSSPM